MGKEDWYDNQFDWGCRKKATIMFLVILTIITLGAWKMKSSWR